MSNGTSAVQTLEAHKVAAVGTEKQQNQLGDKAKQEAVRRSTQTARSSEWIRTGGVRRNSTLTQLDTVGARSVTVIRGGIPGGTPST